MVNTTNSRIEAIISILEKSADMLDTLLMVVHSDSNNAYEDGFMEWSDDPRLKAFDKKLAEARDMAIERRDRYQYQLDQQAE